MNKYLDKLIREVVDRHYVITAAKFSPTLVGFMLDVCVEKQIGSPTNLYLPRVYYPPLEFLCGLKLMNSHEEEIRELFVKHGGVIENENLCFAVNCQHGLIAKVKK